MLVAERMWVDWHVEHVDAFEQVMQPAIKLLQALHTPELRVKLTVQPVQVDKFEHVRQFNIELLQSVQ